MSQLYFNNNQKPNVDLKKAEILIYYEDFNKSYSYTPTNFPVKDPTNDKINGKSFTASFGSNSSPLTIYGISKNFYPISMTIWGKYYDENNNTFRMVEMNDNNNNVTTFTVNSDDTISLSIKLLTNTIGLGVDEKKKGNYLQSAVETGKISNPKNPPLISKIIILYDVQEEQSMIKNTDTKELYTDMYNKMYIGIM